MRSDAFLSYSTNQEIPSNVQAALQLAIELRRAADAADIAVKDIEARKSRMVADQDRIRRNLEAVGNQTQQGRDYIQRLTALDNEIDSLTAEQEKANTDAKTARESLENYLNGLKL
jgi:predicted  nucleic acid-binding Zn-ribbon protein